MKNEYENINHLSKLVISRLTINNLKSAVFLISNLKHFFHFNILKNFKKNKLN